MKKSLLVSAFVMVQFSAVVFSQSIYYPQPISVPGLSPMQLDSMVAPIALYPDPLLSQVLVASTYPQEVAEAAQWVRQNRGLTGSALQEAARAEDWDPSIQALLAFPDVLDRLSENIQWTTNLGTAFLTQQASVMDSVQRLRSQAMASGALTTNGQTVVTSEPQGPTTIIAIQPSSPEVIYVPVYDPLVVWGPISYPYPALRYEYAPVFVRYNRIGFLPGIHIRSWYSGWYGWNDWGWHSNWYGRTVVVNNNFFSRYGYNTRPVVRSNRVVVNRVVSRQPLVRSPQPVVRSVPRAPVFAPPVRQPNVVRQQPNAYRQPNVSRPRVDNNTNRPTRMQPAPPPSFRAPSPSAPARRNPEPQVRREPSGKKQSSSSETRNRDGSRGRRP